MLHLSRLYLSLFLVLALSAVPQYLYFYMILWKLLEIMLLKSNYWQLFAFVADNLIYDK